MAATKAFFFIFGSFVFDFKIGVNLPELEGLLLVRLGPLTVLDVGETMEKFDKDALDVAL